MTPKLALVTSHLCHKVLCVYLNSTPTLQIIRLANSPSLSFERVVFPGQRILFEAEPEASLEIVVSETPTAMVSDRIQCAFLQVDTSIHLFPPSVAPSPTAAYYRKAKC